MIRIVEKLILYGFSLYGNGRLKRFVNCCYGIFQQLYYKTSILSIVVVPTFEESIYEVQISTFFRITDDFLHLIYVVYHC
ncbi:hypothetical protein AR546_16960 [Leptospira interrogans serovar Canicola]|nr:hypothetical protein B2G47_10790 [Leptospira interrogans serovar Canicola]OLZ30303.1 hypothetical protein AR546_16960 [Leptospira interrogans serovar Canicola]OMH63358.1 hypothetical protein BW243_13335 [Leptospira interrogans serovar Pomona]POR17963.1 hypothetical protein B0T34_12450 [Leptospira interrogans serovar Canicola]